MTLTANQEKYAFNQFVDEFLKLYGAMPFTKAQIKQAVNEAHTWAELASTKTSFNNALTAGPFKTNATADQKRLALILALLAIIKA
ncbi:MAG: hypothetical protein DA330_09525 [Nitrososphaera sp.]|nr:hypothetical protein [Nitrososphaera sp.]